MKSFELSNSDKKFTYIFNHFYAVRRESYQIRWNSTN